MQLIKHIGTQCPVPPDSMVIYNTISKEGEISHVHLPMKAIDLNWTHSPVFGRINEYRRVN